MDEWANTKRILNDIINEMFENNVINKVTYSKYKSFIQSSPRIAKELIYKDFVKWKTK